MYPREGPIAARKSAKSASETREVLDLPSGSLTLNLSPRWMTQISPGATIKWPNSVWMSSRPSWGTMSMSPSLLMKAFLSIEVLQRYMWIASPVFSIGEPVPAIVFIPSTKSTLSEEAGRGKGFHAIWVGETDTLGLRGENSEQSFISKRRDQLLCDCQKKRAHIFIVRHPSETLVSNAGPHPVEPQFHILRSRGHECCRRYLLCVQSELDFLRRVLTDRKNLRNCLARKWVTKSDLCAPRRASASWSQEEKEEEEESSTVRVRVEVSSSLCAVDGVSSLSGRHLDLNVTFVRVVMKMRGG